MATSPAKLTIVSHRDRTAPTAPATNRPQTAPAGWSLHRTLVVAGFLAVVAAVLAYHQGNVAAFFTPESIPLLPGLVATLALVHRETPRRLLAAALTVAIEPLLVLFAFGGLFELNNPLLGGGYLAIMLLLAALVLAVPAGVQGWRHATAGRMLPPAQGGLRTSLGLFALGATALLLGAGAAGVLAAGQANSVAAGSVMDFAAPTVRVAAQNFAFPADVQVPIGQVTELAVENRDSAGHTFTYTAGGTTYSHDLLPGSTAKFLVKFDQAGTIEYWCKPHSSGAAGARTGMMGRMVVA